MTYSTDWSAYVPGALVETFSDAFIVAGARTPTGITEDDLAWAVERSVVAQRDTNVDEAIRAMLEAT